MIKSVAFISTVAISETNDVVTSLKLFQNYFRSLLQLVNIFQQFTVAEIIVK